MTHLQRVNGIFEHWKLGQSDFSYRFANEYLSAQIKMLFSFVMLHSDLFINQKRIGCLIKKNLSFQISLTKIHKWNEWKKYFKLNYVNWAFFTKFLQVLWIVKRLHCSCTFQVKKDWQIFFFVCITTTKYVQSK